jgi:alanyl-tRNA synthetase
MTSAEIRQSFLDFFREKRHTVVPSSSLLPDAPNLLFTNAGMNQFVPIFLGQQKPAWNPPRVADTQKCIRAGGKHNDLEDVGLDTYHHTFFEMLGNWSFGDYFKKEAIEWAWELLVDRWKFPAQRLYATVYKPGPGEPSAFDQEAHDRWARLFREADLDPAIHIVNGGKADNFWMMGDTGPCGPCSEVHVDLTPDGDTRGALVNKEDPRCIEIWNLVFIQFNAQPVAGGDDPGGVEYVPLAARHVDTGMGFERVTAIIQGTKHLTDFSGTISNYETDIFRPIFDELEKLSGKKYASTLPDPSQLSTLNSQHATDVAFRVIADHIRTLSFAIADGIIPSNEGRGYVLRRVLRRAIRYGRTLDFHEPFFFKLVDVLALTMGDVFPEVRAKQKAIKETIRREEEAFNKTLDSGIEQFNGFVALTLARSVEFPSVDFETAATRRFHLIRAYRGESCEDFFRNVQALFPDSNVSTKAQLQGEHAFKLYDTYGFPLDLTQLMARERGLDVDVVGFEKLMEEQRSRARAAQKKTAIEIVDLYDAPTKFVGYDKIESPATLLGVLADSTRRQFAVFDVSPFYAEMGGQVGDQGKAYLKDQTFEIKNTVKRGSTFYHELEVPDFPIFTNFDGEAATLKVDVGRRRAIERHHTVTHILHWALHEVVSRDASQKGSYVGPDKLTFDFSSAALTKQQVRDVEKLVNEKIAENAPVSWTEIPYAEVRKRKDIIQFFGEKYGDTVRVLQIGGAPHGLNGYSMELCGGTHVRSTNEIAPFRIVKEEAIAAGIRRIEAVAGDATRSWAGTEAVRQQEKFATLARKKPDIAELPAFESNAATAEMLKQIDARAAHLEKVESEVREWEKKSSKAAEAELKSRAARIANELAALQAGKGFCVAELPDADGKLLQAIVDVLKPKFNGPIFLVSAANGSVALVASVPKGMTSKFQANKIIQEIAPIVGGKGGGRPESAQGGGTDPSKVGEALAKAKEILS